MVSLVKISCGLVRISVPNNVYTVPSLSKGAAICILPQAVSICGLSSCETVWNVLGRVAPINQG